MIRALLAPLFLALALAARAQTTLDLRDADIRAFIADVAKVTGASFVIDPRVQGTVSVVSDRPLSRQAYFELFLATLRAHGFVAVPTGAGQYRIQPAEAGAGATGRFTTAVIPLAHIDAASAVESLRPVLSRNGTAAPNRAGNAVIVTDFADNVARARQTLAAIDRDRAAAEVVTLKDAPAREVAQALDQLIRRSRGPDGQGPTVALVAVESANAIAIRGEAGQVARLAALARDLDRRAAEGGETRVIFLNHADAGSILPVLQTLVGQPPAPAQAPRDTTLAALAGTPFGAGRGPAREGPEPPTAQAAVGAALGVAAGQPTRPASIARFEGANAIVISARGDLLRELTDVVRQLDRERSQVQVEAIIVEISDTLARQLGIQWLAKSRSAATPFLSTNFTNAAPDLLALAGAVAVERKAVTNPDLVKALVANAVNALSQTPVYGGTAALTWNVGNAVMGTIINAAQNDSASNVLATPSVMALDNQPARLLVGQEIPIITGEALSQNLDNQFRTVARQDVGVQLVVRPQINAGGTIKLEIRQTVSSIASVAPGQGFILNKREVETVVTVADGEILALGGLLSEQERRSLQKVPGLGDIPAVGELFRSRNTTREKTNLMVFLRPTIVTTREEAAEVTAARWNAIRTRQEADSGFSSLDALAFEYLRTPPPPRPRPLPSGETTPPPSASEG
ncbi:MAG: type II secretion system secretin GspD [Sphingomonadaceae bacterium]|uniref:type II secretion system secretin GspD n=1 Tax=Thermaurantiacus sp. TaxID=2820283 RepID=UPI00298F146C|nr:type II secretion system secretin GspD [Thermaurantiacus sp.]MCS6987415.1 type II secretion system secretin GspD [Sphingomonadaceae bacterium]MDW8415335.1 type II secretion system secretin GspD [Thermaurantiacus sp.]